MFWWYRNPLKANVSPGIVHMLIGGTDVGYGARYKLAIEKHLKELIIMWHLRWVHKAASLRTAVLRDPWERVRRKGRWKQVSSVMELRLLVAMFINGPLVDYFARFVDWLRWWQWWC